MIEELTHQASLELLARSRLGRLACTRGDQPYVVPIYFAYARQHLYGFSTMGQKVEWMRTNPLVCIEVDEIVRSNQWVSVVVLGRYEELTDTPEWRQELRFAHDLLKAHAAWWEPGYVKTIIHGTERPLEPLYYRVCVQQVTGHRAVP